MTASTDKPMFQESRPHYVPYSLNPGQTRVFRIDSTDPDGILRCYFKVIDIKKEKPKYYAASYVWGPETETRDHIILDGVPLRLSPNHVVMLRGVHDHLSHRGMPNAHIWVDAISIDQNDEREKSEQVKQMDLVYRSAQSVLIWLGSANSDVDMAMTVLQWLGCRNFPVDTLNHNLFPPTLDRLVTECRTLFGVSSDELEALFDMVQGNPSTQNPMFYCHRIWKAWYQLASKDWFVRVWTLQELLLARQAFFVCGTKYIDWKSLQLMTQHPIMPQRRGQLSALETELFTARYNNLSALMLDKQGADSMMSKFDEVRFAFSYTMLSSNRRNLRATKLHDHIYGKLGLVRAEIRNCIPVDYDLPPEEVLKQALKISCFNNSHPDFSRTRYILSLWEYGTAVGFGTEEPSWVSFRPGQTRFYKDLCFIPTEFGNACRGLNKDILEGSRCRSITNDIVELDVYHIDTIETVLPSPFINPWRYDEEAEELETVIREGIQQAQSQPVSAWLEEIEHLLQTVTTGPSGHPARDMFLYDLFRTPDSATNDLEQRFSVLRRYCAGASIATLAPTDLEQMQLGSSATCLTRRASSSYCRTVSGKFGRCLSQDVQAQDMVCMIPHGEQLHIFRPVVGRDTHRRITRGWFCGWSHGESTTQVNNGTLRSTALKVE